MAPATWIGQNWFALIQTTLLAAGVFLIGTAILLDARARRAANLIQLTQQHRDLWERMYIQPELSRILDPEADTAKAPVTAEEEMFVAFLILHLSSTLTAMRAGLFQKLEGLQNDVRSFFSLPIPGAVWKKMKPRQEPDFVRFVDRSLSSFSAKIES
jgi:hypothetical protein